MNKERRETLKRAAALLEEAKSLIETAGEEEREYHENMPEALQRFGEGREGGRSRDGSRGGR